VKDQDIGVDLYKGDAISFYGWKKLSLGKTNGVFVFSKTPCTN
jgi:hypothetical protein